MTEINNKNDCSNEKMLSLDQLRTLPGMEHFSDVELKELEAFLEEYSLILYDVLSKSAADQI